MYDTIIFDCDGTLVDSEKLNNKACTDSLVKHGVTAYSYEYVLNNFGGMTMNDIRALVLKEQGVELPDAFITDFIELAHAYKKTGLDAIDGALAAIDALGKTHKICVASNGERSLVFESLHVTNMFDRFGEDRIFTRIQVPRGKPAPDLFLFAAEKLGSNADKCIVIEDSPSGVMAGVAAQMHVIGFTGAHHDGSGAAKLTASGADVICHTWPEILHYISLLTATKAAM